MRLIHYSSIDSYIPLKYSGWEFYMRLDERTFF